MSVNQKYADPIKLVLLDRDGTINVEVDYLHNPDEVAFYPNTVRGLKKLRELGCLLGIVSNQSGVARGYFGAREVEAVNERLLLMLRAEGVQIEAVEFCPHAPEDGCECRKPGTGMLRRIAGQLGISLSEAVMIGDKLVDMQAGRSAGTRTILVRTGYGAGDETTINDLKLADAVVDDLYAAADIIHGWVTRSQ